MQFPSWVRVAFGVLLLLWFTHKALVAVAVDWLWFDAVGYLTIFKTSLGARVALWVGTFLASAAVMGANIKVALGDGRIDWNRLNTLVPDLQLSPTRLRTLVRLLLLAWIALPSLLVGSIAASAWLDVLSFVERQQFGQTDPIFNLDAGFYVFTLPVLELAQILLTGLLTITILPVALLYILRSIARHGAPRLDRFARNHLLLLGALFFVVLGFGWWIDRFGLLFDKSGVVWGVGYADHNGRVPGMLVMVAASAGVSLSLLGSLLRQGWRLPAVAIVTYVLCRLIAVNLYPSMVQDYYVGPNELEVEREYLTHNIQATRNAYALERIEVKPFDAGSDLTMADIRDNPLTIRNVRVWDDRPLLTTYGQLQEIRLYYDFVDVDVDRYTIDGQPRQVMLSARELNYANVTAQARSWVNEHFQYTHGYGLTMSPVNVVTTEGLPYLFIQDIPPDSKVDIPVDQPAIYYGELTQNYVLVGTSAEEFDYPLGDQNAYTRYAGEGGVGIGGALRKALFSLYFGELDILISQYMQPESKVLFRRRIKERAHHIAPFLHFDGDPYLVVADGRLVWMLDAYTITDRYPYAEPLRLQGRRGSFNYIRNSVKLVIDAYHGSVDLYIADESDPIIATYARIFDGAFKPMSALPESLAAHIRYPVDFFDIQAAMYRAYHMTDPTVFYNKEDMWEIPRELYSGQEQAMESYYLIMKLPGEDEAEFILLVPFSPTNKDNMIAWMAARCDPDNYGKLILYQFPKQKLIYGPRQIEARIDQTPEISEQMTLWSQAGSRVVRGNLLVIPIGDSLMYVEPLYLQAESSQLPELKRVIVSYENRIAMEETLAESLAAVFFEDVQRDDPGSAMAGGMDGDPTTDDGDDWRALSGRAAQVFADAVAKQQDGDWAGYGSALDELSEMLTRLQVVAGADSFGDDEGTDAADSPADSLPEGAVPEGLVPAGEPVIGPGNSKGKRPAPGR